ncbi:MAG: hypothetical protein GXP25_25420 [Planctomycetes bacterium]|nr:hypothetical protein [Planctomycetota bacterium]
MTDIKICEICRKSVPQKDIDQGLAVERNGKWICAQCAAIGRKHKDPFHQDVLASLEKINEEVRSVYRIVSFKEANVWTVLGAVLQIFVVFGVAVSFSQISKLGIALWWMGLAVVLQVMALTFFTIGK